MALPNAVWGEAPAWVLDQTNQSPAIFKLDASGNVTGLVGPDGSSNFNYSQMKPEHSAIRVQMANAVMLENLIEPITQSRISNQTKDAPTGQVWYVRPNTSHSGTRDGTSYATAWGGVSEIVWGTTSGVGVGDTLYVCGAHTLGANWSIGPHLAANESERVTIRGDYASDPGSFTASGAYYINVNRNYTTLAKLIITAHTSSTASIYINTTTGVVVDMCTCIGGVNAITAQTSSAFVSADITNNELYGQSVSGISFNSAAAGVVHNGFNISGNYIHDIGTDAGTAAAGIRLSIESGAFDTGRFTSLDITDNVVARVKGHGIWVRCGYGDTTTPTVVFGSDVNIARNWVTSCGRPAGTYGSAGAITAQGLDSTCSVSGNHVWSCYVTGAGIQTSKGDGLSVFENVIHNIYSGTPIGSYQDGLPIDANGIFIDNLSEGTVVYENLIFDLEGTGQANSGVGIAMWNCANSTFRNNVVVNVVHGMSYGAATESGNVHSGNLIIDCTNGIFKVGDNPITHTAKNNEFVRCENAIAGGAVGTLVVT